MKGIKLALGMMLILITTNIFAGTIDVTWVTPVARDDGTALLPAEIATFRISYGTTSGTYTSTMDVNSGTATAASITLLPGGTYYVVMSVIDTNGNASIFNAEQSITLGTASPKSVTGMKLTVGASQTP